jgi:cytosine deaminase
MNVINARLRGRDGLFTIGIDADTITRIDAQHAPLAPGHADDVDAGGRLAIAPLVEPHIHLDAVLTAGEPAWNMSGTLFEGIERWSERKATITHDDTKRARMRRSACCAITASSTCAPTSTSPTRRSPR